MWKPQANEKVELMFSTRIGSKSVAITPCSIKPETHCFTWTKNGVNKRKDGSERITYSCSECRRIRDSGEAARKTPLPSWVAIQKIDREVCWEGSGNGAHHFCSGPQERLDVSGKAMKRSLGAEVATGSVEKPIASVVKLEKKILESIPNADSATLLQVRTAASCEKTTALKKFLQRCTEKRFPPLKYMQNLMDKEFDGLRYIHRGSITKVGTEHFHERFLLYGNLAIFATDAQLNLYRKSNTIICDGSFKYRPQDSYQIYRIFGFAEQSHCVLLITVIMRGNDRKMYDKMWKKVSNAVKPLGRLHVKFANFDCEKAAFKSFKNHFPDVSVKMCSFHVKQALNRKVQSVGLMPAYQDDIEIERIIRRIGALQLAPPGEWSRCIELIKTNVEHALILPIQTRKLLEILDYYRTTWIGLGQSFFSLFGIKGPRTTNLAESYHGRQKYHLLMLLIVRNRELHYREQKECEAVLEGRVQPNKPQERYAEITSQLIQLQSDVTDFLNDDYSDATYHYFMGDYLSQVGKLMGMKATYLKEKRKGKCAVNEESEEENDPVEIEPVISDHQDETALLLFEAAEKEEMLLDSNEAEKKLYKWEIEEPVNFLQMVGDGNCLYRAISFFVAGNQFYHLQVRKELMKYLLDNLDAKWAGIFGSPEEIKVYVAMHQKEAAFGYSKNLILAARLYQLNFILYKPDEIPKFAYFSADYEAVNTPLRSSARNAMVVHRGVHFDVALV